MHYWQERSRKWIEFSGKINCMKMALNVIQGSGTVSQEAEPRNTARWNPMLKSLYRCSGTSRESPTSKHGKKKKHMDQVQNKTSKNFRPKSLKTTNDHNQNKK